MELYTNAGQATLSQNNGETDNLIFSAIRKLPVNAVAGIMPIVKTKGPTSTWVEPYYGEDDKVVLLAEPVSMFEPHNVVKRLEFSAQAADDLRMTYTTEAFENVVQGWFMEHKNRLMRERLRLLLQSGAVSALPAFGTTAPIAGLNATDDISGLRNAVTACIMAITKDHQLGLVDFTVVAPYEASASLYEVQEKIPNKLHFFFDDVIDQVYVFPTGDGTLSRAGVGYFEYADEVQRTVDSQTGSEVYFIYNRATLRINPLHAVRPLIRRIEFA